MRTKTTITLLVFTCLLAGLVLLMREKTTPPAETPSSLLPINVDRITMLKLARGEVETECLRTGADWLITRPAKARANPAAVDRILSTLGDMQRLETITSEQRRRRGLTLDDYGVGDTPLARITLGNTRTNLTLLLGRDALDSILYARFAGEDNVLTTKAAILSVLPGDPDLLRDLNLVRGDASFASRLEIARPAAGFVQATRKDGQWTMLQPAKGVRLNNDKVNRLLKLLHGTKAERFVTSAEPAKTGLDNAQTSVRITVWDGDGTSSGQQLIIGGDDPEHKDEVFAKLADSECVCTVRKELLDAFNVKASDLRDSIIFPMSPADIRTISFHDGERKVEFRRNATEWVMVAPRRMKTDAAVMDELLTRLCSLQIAEFIEPLGSLSAIGLDPPLRRIEVSTAPPEDSDTAADQKQAQGISKTLLIGNAITGGQAINTRLEDEPSVLRVAMDSLEPILAGRYSSLPVPVCSTTNGASSNAWMNPLMYGNRTMLALDRSSICAVSLVR
ncbi:MAG: DUF4340 domain-containing protein, partial [bacterium]